MYKETITWYEVVKREPTEEEREEYRDEYGEVDYMLDCPMPEDGDEILVATSYGVDTDTVYMSGNGYSLEDRGDWDDVIAWAYMPKYKEEQDENKEVN